MKHASKKLTALLLALVLTLSIAFASVAASAQTVEIAETSYAEYNTPVTMNPNSTTTAYIKKDLPFKDQIFYFKLTVPSSGSMTFKSTFSRSSDNKVSNGGSKYDFYDSNRQRVFGNWYTEDDVIFLKAGTYYVGIRTNGSPEPDKLVVTNTFKPGTEDFAENVNGANNDTKATANTIKVGQTVTGQVGHLADTNDVYKLTVKENTRLLLNHTTYGKYVIKFTVENDQKVLFTNGDRTNAIDCYLTPDTYYINVLGSYNHQGKYSFNTKVYNTVSGLKASAGTNSVTLSWNKMSNASGYQIKQKINGSWKHLKYRAGAAGNRYTVSSLKKKTAYSFAVRPYFTKNGVNYFGTYAFVNARTLLDTPAAPALKNTKNGVQISWKRVAGAAKYRIFRKQAGQGWKKVTDTNNAYVDKTARNGVRYTYTIRCISADGKAFTSAYNTKGTAITCRR